MHVAEAAVVVAVVVVAAVVVQAMLRPGFAARLGVHCVYDCVIPRLNGRVEAVVGWVVVVAVGDLVVDYLHLRALVNKDLPWNLNRGCKEKKIVISILICLLVQNIRISNSHQK